MRSFETRIQQIKHDVLKEVAGLAFDSCLASQILDIPKKLFPGPKAQLRCCIFKERAIVGERIKLAMGGDSNNSNVIEVLDIACDECPVTEFNVSPACRGCLATRCINTCPKDAIAMVGHRAVIDHTKCIACGRCLNACPYNAIIKSVRPCEAGCECNAISMGPDRKALIDYDKCTACGSCLNQCPFGAIMDKSYILKTIGLMKESKALGYKLYAAVAPSIAGQFQGATPEQVAASLKKLGFSEVVEVAIGADMTSWEEAEELYESDGFMTSSCCPAFVSYVEKHFPQLINNVSKTPSPMIMTGRYIREKDPEARIVFIGPCVAKKSEVQEKGKGLFECAITFEEITAMLDSRGIDPLKMKGVPFEGASGYARGFAASGGVMAAVKRALSERGLSDDGIIPMACDGLENCKAPLLKAKVGKSDITFLEGMACKGGCIGGPGTIRRDNKLKGELKKYADASNKDNISVT